MTMSLVSLLQLAGWASLWQLGAGNLVLDSNWRACEGFATNIAYITGTDVDYSPSWATTTSKSAYLDAGKSSESDLEAACEALLVEGQVGEIYEMEPDNAGNGCTTCLRMAIYNVSEVNRLVGTLANTEEGQKKWVCGKGATPPVRPPCNLKVDAKWRACEGFATNIAYITGTNVNYSPSWATTTSQSAYLDAGKSSDSDLAAACEALLEEGQVGEIYEMEPDNAGNGCTNCLRMAIYSASETDNLVGTVEDAGTQRKWVCGKASMPAERPTCPAVTPTSTPAAPTPAAPAPAVNSTGADSDVSGARYGFDVLPSFILILLFAHLMHAKSVQ